MLIGRVLARCRGARALVGLAATLLLVFGAAIPAWAETSPPGKLVLIQPASPAPNPFNPGQQAGVALKIQAGVRPSDGLNGNSSASYSLHVVWSINGVAPIVSDIPINRPFAYVNVGNQQYIQVPVTTLTWNGRTAGGSCAADGALASSADIQFLRVKNGSTKDIQDQQTAAITVTVAGTAPVLTVAAPAPGAVTKSPAIVFSGTVSSLLPTSLTIAGQAAALSGGEFSQSVPLNGECDNAITLVATDCAGRSTSRTVHVTRDSVAPQIAAASPGEGDLLSSSSPPLAFTWSDACSGIRAGSASIVIDGHESVQKFLVTASGATVMSGAGLGLPDGAHTVVATIADAAGNSSSVTRHFTTDATSPAVTVTVPGADATNTTTSASPVIVVGYTDATSGVDLSSVRVTLDGQVVAVTPGASSTTFTPAAPLVTGRHTVSASVRDRAGNTGSASVELVVAPPPVPDPPSVNAYPVTTNVPVLALSGTKPKNTSIRINGTERVPLDASTTWSTTKTLLEGSNSLQVTDADAQGVASAPVTVSVTLDTVPPPPPEVDPVASDVKASTITLSGKKPAGTAIEINGVVRVPLNDSTTWSVQITLQPGKNSFVVEAVDAAGNRSITEGGKVASVARAKPVIGPLVVAPAIAPTGTSVAIDYKLFALVPPADNADLHVTVNVEDGDRPVRTVFDGVQQGSPTGTPYTVTWDQRDDAGQLVDVNTSYRIVVSADRANATTQPPELVNANPKESAVTVTGSQQVVSPDAKLRVIFRPDDAVMRIASVTTLSAKQAAVLAARKIRPIGKPYRITVDKPFTSSVVAMLTHKAPVGRFLRPLEWDASQQDWVPVGRTTWNPANQTLCFPLRGEGLIIIGSGPDAEPPRVKTTASSGSDTTIRIADNGTGINPAKTRIRCRGRDLTATLTTRSVNGTREQILTTTDPAAKEGKLVIYLEDWAGNGRLYRVQGGVR